MSDTIGADPGEWLPAQPAGRADARDRPHPTPRPRRIRLATVGEVADELARVYRETRAGRLDTADASRLTYILSTLGKLREAAEIEQRIAALESTAREIQNSRPT